MNIFHDKKQFISSTVSFFCSFFFLLSGTQMEVQYAMLKHLKLLFELPAAKGVFDDG